MESDSKTSSFKVLIISGLLTSLSPQLVDANTPISSVHTSATGNRLNKPNQLNSSAVQIYSREDILRIGESSIANFICNLPINI